ncbi:hypothetical protein IGH98_24130, partial [Bacillus thuringiensis]|nr:hypothetical protein [Bacillus thuringiensis]
MCAIKIAITLNDIECVYKDGDPRNDLELYGDIYVSKRNADKVLIRERMFHRNSTDRIVLNQGDRHFVDFTKVFVVEDDEFLVVIGDMYEQDNWPDPDDDFYNREQIIDIEEDNYTANFPENLENDPVFDPDYHNREIFCANFKIENLGQVTSPQVSIRPSSNNSKNIAAVSRIPNSMEVWWIGANGSVQDSFWYEGQNWQSFELAPAGSASQTGRVTAVSRIPGGMEVWWIGANGSVQGAYWPDEGGKWGRYELAPAGSASPNGGITAESRIPSGVEVWWIGANGSVQGAYWPDEGGKWGR